MCHRNGETQEQVFSMVGSGKCIKRRWGHSAKECKFINSKVFDISLSCNASGRRKCEWIVAVGEFMLNPSR